MYKIALPYTTLETYLRTKEKTFFFYLIDHICSILYLLFVELSFLGTFWKFFIKI